MPPQFTLADLHAILSVKLCLLVFIILGAILIYFKKYWPLFFLIITGGLTALAYYFFANDLGLSFWGLSGDEVTIGAMFQMFAHGSFLSDFGFPSLPPYYPPLYFWIFAIPGRIFSWNGVQMMKAGSMTIFLIFPALIYLIQLWFWRGRKEIMEQPGKLAWFLVPFFIFILNDWDAFILKPYEILAATLTILWVSFLLWELTQQTLTKKKIFIYGLSGGIIFMIYYLWLVFGAIGIACFGLFISKEKQKNFYFNLVKIGSVCLVVASPYLLPMISVYHRLGTENWGVGMMTAKGLAFPALMAQWFSWRGILFLLSFIILLWYRRNTHIKALLCMFVAGYIWLAMGWVTILFFSAPLQEFKPFDFYYFTISAFALAFGAEKLFLYCQNKYPNKNLALVFGLVFLVFVSNAMFFGAFIDDPAVQERRVKSKSLRPLVAELINFLAAENNFLGPNTLSAGAGEVYAFTPINSYIYFNQHNNHPATRFSEKKILLENLVQSKDPLAFYNNTRDILYGPIDRFIMFKKNDDFVVYLHIDVFPNGARDQEIIFPAKLFAEPYFKKVFENSIFAVWDRQINIPETN